MSADIYYSPVFLLNLCSILMLLILMLVGFLLEKELTRPAIIIIGIAFIEVGVLGHVSVLRLESGGEVLIANKLLSKSIFGDFLRYKNVFAYIFPAISAAIGTNVISDALLKHHTYSQEFSFRRIITDALFPIVVVILVSLTLKYL